MPYKLDIYPYYGSDAEAARCAAMAITASAFFDRGSMHRTPEPHAPRRAAATRLLLAYLLN